MKVGVIGASGYAGGELLRLISAHPHFEAVYIAAGSNAGELIADVHPHLSTFGNQRFELTDAQKTKDCDLVFVALPHGESAKFVSELDSNISIVDLGADYRLKNPTSWQKYYQTEYAGNWLYGLPELPGYREQIRQTKRVANPGCYATAIALAAAPVVRAGMIDNSDIVVVAASGTTGAGRSAKINLSASEVMNSLTSYKFGGVHQHTPEIEESLQSLVTHGGQDINVSFTPILAPMPRGILATVTSKTTFEQSEIRKVFADAYKDEQFVHLLEIGKMPETSSLIGSNGVHLQVAVDAHSKRFIASVAIDNLGKGAAGQAVQNANLICGYPENAGISPIGIG